MQSLHQLDSSVQVNVHQLILTREKHNPITQI